MPKNNQISLDDAFEEVNSQSSNDLDTAFEEELGTPTKVEVTPTNKTKNKIVGATTGALGLAGLAGAGFGMYKAGKWYLDPFAKMSQLNKEALPLKKGANVPIDTVLGDLSKAVKQQIGVFSSEAQSLTDNMANDIKTKIPQWKEAAYANYGKGIESINKSLSNQGLNFSTQNFNQMLESTASYLESQGFEKEANNVRNAVVSKKGGMLEHLLNFDDAKSKISNLVKNNKSASRTINENWMEFIEKDPIMKQVPETADTLKRINSDYKTFKQHSNALDSLSNPKYGTAKTKGLSMYLQDALSGKSQDASRALQYLSKGSETVPALEGAAQHLSKLSELSSKQTELQQFLQKANEFALKAKPLSEKISRRTGMTKAAAVMTGIGKLGGLFGMYPMVGGASGIKEMIDAERKLGVVGGLQFQVFKQYNPNKTLEDFINLRKKLPEA